jgi:hypothetical protein
MSIDRYILTIDYSVDDVGRFIAAVKPGADAIEIARKNGFVELRLSYNRHVINRLTRLLVYFKLVYALTKLFIGLPRSCYLLVQYPIPISVRGMPEINTVLAFMIRRKKGVRGILLIHDINGLRQPDGAPAAMKQEINVFNSYADIIAHSRSMDLWLRNHGLKSRTTVLGVFDYLIDNGEEPPTKDKLAVRPLRNRVVFAGNLRKSEFVNQLFKIPAYEFHLYGPNCSSLERSGNIFHHGALDPIELVRTISMYDFGLVWDGNTADKLDSQYGQYIKFNSPHKLSCYIVAGLPIITSSEAGIARFVLENEIGICVSSLNGLTEISVSPEAYARYSRNVNSMRKRLRSGSMLSASLSSILGCSR